MKMVTARINSRNTFMEIKTTSSLAAAAITDYLHDQIVRHIKDDVSSCLPPREIVIELEIHGEF